MPLQPIEGKAKVFRPSLYFAMQSKRKSQANQEKLEKLEKTTSKLVKSIRFELEVQKNIGQVVFDLHKKRLQDIQKYIPQDAGPFNKI